MIAEINAINNDTLRLVELNQKRVGVKRVKGLKTDNPYVHAIHFKIINTRIDLANTDGIRERLQEEFELLVNTPEGIEVS